MLHLALKILELTGRLTSLEPNTKYEFYAYATTGLNAAGYKDDILTFTTLAHTPPKVTTLDATAIGMYAATLRKTVAMYASEKKGMLASLEGKKDIKRVSMMSIVKREDELTDMTKRAMDNMKKIIEDRVEIDRNQVSMQSLEPWLDLDIPMEFTHTERTSFLIGTIVKVDSQEEIYDGIGLHLVDLSEVEISIVHKDKFQMCIVAVCLKKYENAVENGLHKIGRAHV